MPDHELDVRPLRKPEKHPTIFARFDGLAVGESFVLVNNHDPKHLRDEFDRDHPGGYGWEYLQQERREWKIRITRLTSTPLPRVVADTTDLGDEADPAGAVWTLPTAGRDLDAAIHRMPADSAEEVHHGPDHDTLVHVISGEGSVLTEGDPVTLTAGSVVFLPRRSRRAFSAGPDGLTYLTVSQHVRGLPLMAG